MAAMPSPVGKRAAFVVLNAEFGPGNFRRAPGAFGRDKMVRRTSFMSFASDPENLPKPLSMRELHYTVFESCQLESSRSMAASTQPESPLIEIVLAD